MKFLVNIDRLYDKVLCTIILCTGWEGDLGKYVRTA